MTYSMCIYVIQHRITLYSMLSFSTVVKKVHREFPGKLESNNINRDSISREIWRSRIRRAQSNACTMPNLTTNIVDFRGLDSDIILIIRGGITMSIGNFPESLSPAM